MPNATARTRHLLFFMRFWGKVSPLAGGPAAATPRYSQTDTSRSQTSHAPTFRRPARRPGQSEPRPSTATHCRKSPAAPLTAASTLVSRSTAETSSPPPSPPPATPPNRGCRCTPPPHHIHTALLHPSTSSQIAARRYPTRRG